MVSLGLTYYFLAYIFCLGLLREVKEAKERVRSALKNTGIVVPPGRLTVSLSPADLRKQGNGFDLPVLYRRAVLLGMDTRQFGMPTLAEMTARYNNKHHVDIR